MVNVLFGAMIPLEYRIFCKLTQFLMYEFFSPVFGINVYNLGGICRALIFYGEGMRTLSTIRFVIGCAVLLLTFAGSPLAAAATKTITYANAQDENGHYAVAMMKLALSYSAQTYTYKEIPEAYTQQRMVEEVLNGHEDIMWAATSQSLEDSVLPIRICLYKGLLGHRIFLIRSGDQARFDKVETLDDLRKIPIGQGKGWADTEILQANGLKVMDPVKFNSLMYMLEGGRFDAFPRGVFEPFSEVSKWAALHLEVEQRLMLVYKMPYYFFVSPTNQQLAGDLEAGLNRAIADGSFNKLFLSDPRVQEAVEKASMKSRKIFKLDNPGLPKKTPVDREELWVDASTM